LSRIFLEFSRTEREGKKSITCRGTKLHDQSFRLQQYRGGGKGKKGRVFPVEVGGKGLSDLVTSLVRPSGRKKRRKAQIRVGRNRKKKGKGNFRPEACSSSNPSTNPPKEKGENLPWGERREEISLKVGSIGKSRNASLPGGEGEEDSPLFGPARKRKKKKKNSDIRQGAFLSRSLGYSCSRGEEKKGEICQGFARGRGKKS